MTEPRPELSVVIPVREEVDSVAELYRELRDAVGREAEVLFVDDGSADGTWEALESLAAGDPRVRAFGFRRPFGKSHALAAGFRRARGAVIATLDGDLQDDPRELPRLLERLEAGCDVVGGRRRRRADRPGKVLASRAFNAIVRFVGGAPLRDINCGLKVFRREVVEDLRLASGSHRFLPLLAYWRGFRVDEVDVRHRPRRHGRSRYGGGRFLAAFMDLAVLLFLERFEGRPGRWLAGTGGALALAGGGILTGLFVLQRLTGSIQSRFPLLSLGLLLVVVGTQLATLGLVAELLAYHVRRREPAEPAVRSAAPETVAPPARAAATEPGGTGP